jgi:pilus assembly protein FimV
MQYKNVFLKPSIFLGAVFFCHLASALGLGEINPQSELNEPLRASIEILGSEGMDENELKVMLASQQDFDRLGVSRDFLLTTLRFEVDLGAQPSVIRISTDKVVQEPFLNFVLEVQTPQTRMLKEFTILLDPR